MHSASPQPAVRTRGGSSIRICCSREERALAALLARLLFFQNAGFGLLFERWGRGVAAVKAIGTKCLERKEKGKKKIDHCPHFLLIFNLMVSFFLPN